MSICVQPGLGRFVLPEPPLAGDRITRTTVVVTLLATLLVGVVLWSVRVPVRQTLRPAERSTVTVRLTEVAVPRPAQPKPEPEAAARLEPETIMAAPIERPAPAKPKPEAIAPAPAATEPAAAPVRRVFGVRKVYARGLGTGSGEGLVTKQGNTLIGPPDTLTATAADLKGALAPLSTVDRAPEPLHRSQPTYSQAMRKARSEGVVEAWLLVDREGNVRDLKVTADIGADSRAVAAEALRRFRFRPAERDGQPVAVWILHRIRFEFQE